MLITNDYSKVGTAYVCPMHGGSGHLYPTLALRSQRSGATRLEELLLQGEGQQQWEEQEVGWAQVPRTYGKAGLTYHCQ